MFAAKTIKKNELIEICPVILVKYRTQQHRINNTPSENILDNYYFDWNKNYWCFPMGYGTLYNHSYHANAKYVFNHRQKLLKYRAVTLINKDEEITINYNGTPNDTDSIDSWFVDHHGKKII